MKMSNMDEIEEEAKAAAEKMVMNMMQRPGQLEKVHYYIYMSKIRIIWTAYYVKTPKDQCKLEIYVFFL